MTIAKRSYGLSKIQTFFKRVGERLQRIRLSTTDVN